MGAQIEITGRKFGRLTAMWPAGTAGQAIHPRAVWLCACDCGGLKLVRRTNLVTGHVRSCGCYTAGWIGRAHRIHGLRNTIEYRMWCDAKKRAEAKSLAFTISPKDVVIPELCPFLGIRLIVCKGQPGPTSPSLDRIKPELGYTPCNIRVISYKANSMKSDSTLEEFELLAKNWRRLCE